MKILRPVRPALIVIASAGLLSESPAGDAADTMVHVATLSAARAAHTATTLRAGQVLIAGGMGPGGGSLATAEVFHAADNTVRRVGSMASRRAGHTATPLADGRVLVAGGYDGDYLNSVELFDPSTGQFARAGTLIEGRSGHTATLLPDGRVLLIGGIGRGWTFLRSAEIYNPATGRSDAAGAMELARESHTATLLANGRVLVVGGHSGRRPNVRVHARAEVFDQTTLRFDPSGELLTPRHKHDALRLPDGRVLIVGGADVTDRVHYATTEVFEPAAGAFTAGPAMSSRRYKIAGTSMLLSNGDVLVTSGARAAELLDAQSFAFREVPGRLPAPYRFATAARLANGDVVVAGGYDDDNATSAGVWRFTRRQD